jgi:pilus assembly protein CpaB
MVGNAPNADQSRFGALSRTILQNIAVLSAGQSLDKTSDGKPQTAQVVNLLVTPAQAEILNLAMSETKVQLVLRNPLDTQSQTPPGTSIAGLFGVPGRLPVALSDGPSIRPPAVAPAAVTHAPPVVQPNDVAHIEVFRGVKKSDETFDLPTGKKK